MHFTVDPRLESSSLFLGDWPLTRVFFKNNADYPWCILVPKRCNVQEIHQLSLHDQHQLIEEITSLSRIMQDYFKPHKMNVGALGNIVAQLHIHVIGRNPHDPLWPHSVWQEALAAPLYQADTLQDILKELREQIIVSHN